MQSKRGIVLWLGLILFAMAVLMNIFGGIGTSCVAFNLEAFPKYSMIADYQWLWQSFVVVTTLIGFAGLIALIAMFKGRKGAFTASLIILILGAIVGGIHMGASDAIIGKAAPANVKFFANFAAMIYFIVLAFPGMKKFRDNFAQSTKTNKKNAAGVTSIIAGLVLITMPIWAGPSHMIGGVNLVNVLSTEIMVISIVLLAIGIAFIVSPIIVPLIDRLKTNSTARKLES
jgi:hypothetical protein